MCKTFSENLYKITVVDCSLTVHWEICSMKCYHKCNVLNSLCSAIENIFGTELVTFGKSKILRYCTDYVRQT